MSTTIDQRVVEMRFDNKHFEQNVATTMSTLDKLKQKLNLSGATKGLEDVNAAAKSNNMPILGSAVEAVSAKFSALQVMGVTALANITNSAVNAGKRIVKSLTIDPIKSGFEEYETKMGSIQTILANTEHQGTTLDDVTAALDKLNIYADKTIYNFQQMTRNIGTFTAAGVDLQTSVESIQGIANLAAVSGSTSQQASTAMYQLSQALASGTVKLQDWNSVVNAGMGGKVFQNALIRTAAMLDGSANDVEAWQKKHIDAYGSFRESLSKEQWLTTEVLTTTLKQFTMAAEEGSDEWNEFKKTLMSSGYTETQAEEILKMANTATDAATKVKTFTQLLDTLKESAQSGWAQTWELIVGDFEEAKAFFTELSDIFGGIIGKSADRRNAFLGDALMSNWDKLISKINDAGIETSKFEESIRKVVGDDKLDTIIQDFGSLEKAVREGGISSEVLKKALDGIGITNADGKINSFVDGLKEIERMLGRGNVGEDVKKLQTALDELGYDLGEWGVDGIIGPVTEKAIKAFQEANGLIADGLVGPETMAALEKAGSKIEDTADGVDSLADSCKDLVDVITEKSGRELILDSLMNVIKAIQRPLEAVGEALRDTFSISPKQLYDALEDINDFTEKLVPKGILEVKTWEDLLKRVNEFGVETNDFVDNLKNTLIAHGIDVDELTKKYGSLGHAFEEGAISFDTIKEALLNFDGITEALLNGGETADKVRRTFEGLFAAVDMVATILAGPFKFAFKIVTETLSRMGLSVLDVTAKIGDGLVKLRDKVDGVIDDITKFIVDNVTKWIEQFRETEFFKTVAGWFADASKTISDAVDNISNKISNITSTKIFVNFTTAWNYLLDLVDRIASSKLGSRVIDGFVTSFGKLKDFFGKFKLPELSLDNLKTWATDLLKIGEKISSSGNGGFLGVISGFGQHLKDNVLSWNWTVFKETALEKFVNFWLTTGDKIKSAFEKGKEVTQAIKRFIFGADEVDLPTILSVAEKFLGILVLMKTLNLLNGMVEPFDNITDALNNFAASMKWKAVSATFKSMALALGALTLCIIVITQIPDMNKAWQAAGMLAGLLIVMGGVATLMGWLSSKIGGSWSSAGGALSILAMMGSIILLMYAIKEIDNMKLKDPSKTFNILAGVLLAMTVGIAAISKAGGSSFRSVAAILTMMAALKMLLEVIESYEAFDWAGKRDAIKRVMEMLVGLSLAIRIASGGTKAGASSSGLALAILAMVFSLKIILSVIKELDEVDDDTLSRGIETIATLLGMMTIMAVAMGLSNKGNVLQKGEKAVNNFKGLAVALLAVVASIWLLGKMAVNDRDVLIEGGNAVGQILLAFTVMLTSVNLACKGLKTAPLITMLVGIGLLLAEIAIIIKILEDIPWQQSVGSAGALGMVLLALTGVIFTLSKIDNGMTWGDMGKIGALFGGLLIVLASLGLVLVMMSSLNATNVISNAGSLTILLAAMAGVIVALSKIKIDMSWGDMGKIGAMFGGLTLVLAALGLVLAEMSALNVTNSLSNASALSILLGAMTLVIVALSKMNVTMSWSDMGKIGTMFGALAIVLAGLGLVLAMMSKLGVQDAIPNAIALSILIGALSLCTIPLAAAGLLVDKAVVGCTALVVLAAVLGLLVAGLSMIKDVDTARANAITLANLAIVLSLCTIPLAVAGLLATSAAVGATALVVLAAVLGLLVAGLSAIKNVDTARENAITLANLAIVLSLCTLPLALAAVIAPAATVGAVLLVALAAVLGLLVWGLSAIKDVDTARENVITIILLVSTLTNMVLLLGELGVNSLIAVKALERLITLVTKIGILAAAIGLLTKDGELIEKGLGVLEKIAGGLGRVISSFGEGLTSGLPAIAENLSGFADNLGGFVTVMNNVDDGIIDKAKNLAEAIAALTKGNFLNNLASFGDGTLSALGEDLSKFAGNASKFITAMDSIKPESASNMETFATAISTMNAVCGDNNLTSEALTKFGESIESFATCITNASLSLNGITDQDVENVKKAAAAGEALAELNKSIPRSGGDWQNFAGEQDLADWGAKISAFADSLVAYSTKVSGTTIDSEAIKSSAEAATAVSDLNAGIPKSGGAWQNFAGEQDIASWGSKIVTFADGLISYANKISGVTIDAEAIRSSAEAAGALVEVNNALPKEDGWWQKTFGQKNMESFGSGLTSFATGLVAYSQAASQIGEDDIESIKNTGKAMDEIKAVVEKIPKTGGTADWFGSRDINGFGTGITAMAKGIKDCIDVAATIDPDNMKISNLSAAMDEIELAFAEVPEVNAEYVAAFKTSVEHLKSACMQLNQMSTAGYDFSGIDGIKSGIKSAASILNDVDTQGLYDKFIHMKLAMDQVSACSATLAGINGVTYGGVDTLKGALNSLAEANVDGVIDAFAGKGESMLAAVNSLISAMSKGLSEGSTTISTEAGNVADAAVKAVKSKGDSFKSAGTDFITCIRNGMSKAASTLLGAGSTVGSMAVAGVSMQNGNMYGAGIDLGSGLVRGINAMQGAVYSAGYALGRMAVRGEKDGQASNSPSKLTIKAGKWIGEGLVIGMDRMGRSVYNAGKSMGETAVGSISNSIRSISDAISTDVDAQPTIRPVLDLSDVRAGAGAIGNLLGAGAPIGVQANINSISSMMNSRNQNGVNDDVVSAINKLHKKMDNLGNTTYQVNGVTYDDGSNIADAVKAITRAAVRERRI